ncbi:MAG: class I SAM-dependent methyltransferase [Deltaproteobacteria bacterium]|nr:class I SAM-dependent methyltransferase [Deltaproteobacteria bacterium]
MPTAASPTKTSPEVAPPGDSAVLRVVNEFYEANPFPGFDAGKYETRQDLVTRASWYARRLDAEIPFDAKVVDVGCGTGQLACFLALKKRAVLGIDYSQHSLDLAQTLKERLALKTVDFRRRNLLDWDLPPNSFDYVFCNGVLHHTSDPYGGFCNLVKITKPGGRLVIGLYNRYGRLMLLVRRRIVALLSRIDPNAKDRAIRKQLVTHDTDEAKRHTWYADQYEHPHESTHTIDEVIEWFRKNNVTYVSSFPHAELFGKSKRIFRPRQLAAWRTGRAAHLLVQLAWIVTQNAGGGYYVMVGQKQA